VKDGWLEVKDRSRRARSYGLSAAYRQCRGDENEMIPKMSFSFFVRLCGFVPLW
jgi:hypothetical protein